MGIDKLKLVMWTLIETAKNPKSVTRSELNKAIIKNIGYWPETIRNARNAMIHLGWIRANRNKYLILRNDEWT